MENEELLYGLMGWLNSDLINFVFQLRSGSAHVSVFELNVLPINLEIINNISSLVRNIAKLEPDQRNEKVTEINDILYNWLELGPKHRARISAVLNRKERA